MRASCEHAQKALGGGAEGWSENIGSTVCTGLEGSSVAVAAATPLHDRIRLRRGEGRSVGGASQEAEGDDGADEGLHGGNLQRFAIQGFASSRPDDMTMPEMAWPGCDPAHMDASLRCVPHDPDERRGRTGPERVSANTRLIAHLLIPRSQPALLPRWPIDQPHQAAVQASPINTGLRCDVWGRAARPCPWPRSLRHMSWISPGQPIKRSIFWVGSC